MSARDVTIPDDFVEQVKHALDHLYDFTQLQHSPLSEWLNIEDQPTSSSGRNLRRILIETIESLYPGDNVYFRSTSGRTYNLLNLYYISQMTIQETSLELGISVRQAYRDLKRGISDVSEVLWEITQNNRPPSEEESLNTPTAIQSELERFRGDLQLVQVSEALQSAKKAVQRLAEQQGIELSIHHVTPVYISTTLPIAQQIWITLLSYCIKHAQRGVMHIESDLQENVASLVITYCPQQPDQQYHVDNTITQLIDQLAWKLKFVSLVEDQVTLTRVVLNMGTDDPKILVIDDNESIQDLIARYLSNHNLQLYFCNDAELGLTLAKQIRPDAILLDIMMPHIDGWELLQRFSVYPETHDIPIIVCSVLSDTELALSLGARDTISKPIQQSHIVDALRNIDLI